MIDSKIDRKVVLQAVKILRKLNDKHYEDSSKKTLLDNTENLFLQVTLRKIPKMKAIKMIKVKLPHSLVTETTDICLITGDLDKKNRKAEIEPDILHYKELLDKHGISQISEVITLRQLRTEYKPYEAKQKLLAAFDIFLADNKIIECLPSVLGKHFFKKRKFPIRINMNTANLKNQIENALTTKVFHLTGHGGTCISEVAYLDMKIKEIIDNVLCMAETISNQLPGGLDNVMGLYLKTSKSKAIPIYMSYDSPNEVNLPDSEEKNEFEIDELSTISNTQVKVFKNGMVVTIKNDVAIVYENEQNKSELLSENKHATKTRMKTLKIGAKSTQADNYEPVDTENVEMKMKEVKTKTSKDDSADVCENKHYKLDSCFDENLNKNVKNEVKIPKKRSSFISMQYNGQEPTEMVKIKGEVGKTKKNITPKKGKQQIDVDENEHYELDSCSDENLNVKSKKEVKLPKTRSGFISIQCDSQEPTEMVNIKGEVKKAKKKITPKKEKQQIEMDENELDSYSEENSSRRVKSKIKPHKRSIFIPMQCDSQEPTEAVKVQEVKKAKKKVNPNKREQQIAFPQYPEKFKLEKKIQTKRKRVESESKFYFVGEQESSRSEQFSNQMEKKIKLENLNVKGSFRNKQMLKNKRKSGHHLRTT